MLIVFSNTLIVVNFIPINDKQQPADRNSPPIHKNSFVS